MTARGRFLRSPWVVLVAALALVALLNLLAPARSNESGALAAGNAGPNGGLAMYLWLQRAGYQVNATTSEPDVARLPVTGSTVMLLADSADISPSRMTAYLDWVRRGGRVVLASTGGTGATLLNQLSQYVVASTISAVRIVQPVLTSPPVSRLAGTTGTVLAGDAADLIAAENASGAVLVQRRLGSGSIWILTAPQLLENDTIAAAQNRRLLLNLAGPPGTTVVLDEFVPPVPSTQVTDWLTQTVWGVVVLFAIAILVIYRFLSGWRLGPPVIPLTLRHRAAAEYVVSLAGLLRRGKGQTEILAIYQRGLQRAVRRRYGDLADAGLPDDTRQRIAGLLSSAPVAGEADLMKRAAAIVEEERILRTAGG